MKGFIWNYKNSFSLDSWNLQNLSLKYFTEIFHAMWYVNNRFNIIHVSGVVSSFRPTTSAKLYASPLDMKPVGYRSKSLPSHASKSQLRKSQSMRTGSTFKPTSPATNPQPTSEHIKKNSSQTNPYAQPIRASRSHSTGMYFDILVYFVNRFGSRYVKGWTFIQINFINLNTTQYIFLKKGTLTK